MNRTDSSFPYPFYSYVPSRWTGTGVALILYMSLIGWFVQSLNVGCRPTRLSVFIFVGHLLVVMDLILRVTVDLAQLNTHKLYRVTSSLLSVPPRLLLFANYHSLVELRGKELTGTFHRLIDVCVLIGAVSADILLGIANELSLNVQRVPLTFVLRQVSAALIVLLSFLFYVVWYLSVPHSRHRSVVNLLAVSSTCVLIEALYVQIISVPWLFLSVYQREFWFYFGHLIPMATALITWTLSHPRRWLPSAHGQSIDLDHSEACA